MTEKKIIGEVEDRIDPIGQPINDENINDLVKSMVAEWEEQVEKPAWWQFWKKGATFYKAIKFLIQALDKLIEEVEKRIQLGPDKKATVLAAIAVLYDYVVKEAFPIWLKPFAGRIKNFIIFTVIATCIDWIVAKYRNGIWKKGENGTEDNQTTETTEETPSDDVPEEESSEEE
jgi:hypothetical protein